MNEDQISQNNQRHKEVARHCMVVHAYYPLGETRVERQALALIDQGVEVDIICLKQSNEPVDTYVDGVHVYRLPVTRHRGSSFSIQLIEYLVFFILAFFRLSKLNQKKRYKVVQVHNLPDFLVFVSLIPKFFGAKIILDLHDLMPEFFCERTQRSMESLPARIICWQEKLACQFSDQIITVTNQWRQSLIERGQPPEKIKVVMNVADDRYFNPNVASDSLQDGKFQLIYHGVMGQRHGLDLLLIALDEVRKTIPEIYLTLHGGGEYRETLEYMADQMGLFNNIHFSRQFMPTEELVKWIKTADLGIVPYRNDTFTGGILPTKLMEYAALGIPAIAARTQVINAYFDDTMIEFFKPGCAKELANCILRLYRDQRRLSDLATNISKFNEQYNWPDQSAHYIHIVERLLEK